MVLKLIRSLVISRAGVVGLICFLLFYSSRLIGQSVLTTTGTDFWLGFMNNYLPGSEQTMAVFISSDQAASGVVEMPLLGWSQSFTTTVGVTTVIGLPQTANNNESALVSNRGIHITSNVPISVYALNHKDNSSDATRILPKPFLDISYLVHGYEGQQNIIDTLRSELLIVATEDDTELEINPSCNMLGGPLQGVPFTIQMDQGETYLLKALEVEDISGTTINGTEASGDCRPFAVFGGSECSFVPQLCSPCDNLFDQMVPSSVWGTEYFLGTFDTWVSSYTYRVTAIQNGTQIFVDGAPAFNLNAGEFEEVNSNEEPIYISSNFPVGVIQYMEGGGCTISGDPSMMTVNSAQQTLNQITFATIQSQFVSEHHIQIIVSTNASDVVFLDGFAIPETSFNPFAGNAAFSFADIEIPEGSHQLQCQQGVIANVYGIGNAESYLYSTGANAMEVEEIPNVICSEDQVVLETAENYTNIWWSTLEDPETEIFNGQPFVINPPISNQIYILHGNNFLSGCPEEEQYSVESPDPLSVNIDQSVIDLCLFEEFTLSSSVSPVGSSYVYQWLEAAAFVSGNEENGVISPWESGTYYLEVTTFSGCGSGRDSVQVNVLNDAITSINATADPLSLCAGETVNLEAQTGFNAGIDFFNSVNLNNTIWEDLNGGDFGELCASIGGSSLFFDGIGNRSIESVDFDMSDGGSIQFEIQISNGSQGCDGAEPGEDVFLQYSTNGGANWTNLLNLFENAYPEFTTVEVILPQAAQSPATRFRWVQPQFSGISQDIWWLDNVVFSTFEQNPDGFTWSSSADIVNIFSATTTSQPMEDAYFFVETSINGCSFVDSVLVEVQPAFDLQISNDTSVCGPFPVPLSVVASVPGFYSYQWNNAPLLNSSEGSSVTATATQDTEFTVTVTSPDGCTSTASTLVDLVSSNPPFISPMTTTVCSIPHALEVIVDGDPDDYIFEWTANDILDNTNSQTVNASPPGGTFHTVEVLVTSTITGCTYTDTQNLSAQFAVFDLPGDTVICESEGFVIAYEVTNSLFNAISWNNADVLSNAFTQFPTITVPGFNGDLIVTMFVPGNGGCSVSDTITIITQNLEYEAADVLSKCIDESVQTSITGDFSTITWTPSPNLDVTIPSQPTFSNFETEVFYFTLDNNGGCALSDSIQVIVNLPESFEIGAEGPFCEGNPIELDNPLEGLTYMWNNGSNTEDLVAFSAGTYWVQVTDGAGCSVFDDIVIETISTNPFEILGDSTACAGEFVSLTADIISDNYFWSNGSTDQSASFSLAGSQIVWAEVVDLNNCSYRDSIEVVFADPISVEITSEGDICGENSTSLAAIVENAVAEWSTGETASQITVSEPGTYSIFVTDPDGCTGIDSLEVNQIIFPELSLDTTFCEGSTVLINPEISNDFVLEWSTGEINSQIEIDTPGNYILTLSQLNCEEVIPFEVLESPRPTLEIITDGEFCSSELGAQEFLLTAISDGNIQWANTNLTGEILAITQSGTYTANAVSEFGCSTEATMIIEENCPEPTLYAANSFTPNDDGINDYWRVEFDGEFDTFSLIIFDRYGQVVFRTNNNLEYWPGNVRGGQYYAKDGVYNYMLNYTFDKGEAGILTYQIRGHITLIR